MWRTKSEERRVQVAPVHRSATAVGIDLGVVRLATLSEGTIYGPPNSFREHQAGLRKEAVTKFSFRFPTGRGPGFLGRRVAARTSIVGGGDHGEGTKSPTPWSRATAARLCQ